MPSISTVGDWSSIHYNPGRAKILNDEVNELHRTGKYDRAVIIAKKALELAEESGPNNVNVATSLNSLARLYKAQGEYALAKPLFKRSLKIDEKVLGPDHPSVATSLDNLALLYDTQGAYALAEPLYKRSLKIYEKALGSDHPSVATILNNLAELYRATNRHKEAKDLELRATEIQTIKR